MSLMTSSTRNERNRSAYKAAPYFRYYIKHNVYQLVLFLVVIILAVIVPCCMEYGRFVKDYPKELLDITQYGKIGFVLSGCMGLFCGMTALSYVNGKQNITCMHSFPLKRTTLFLCETPAGIIYYLLSITIGFAAILIISGFEKCTIDKSMFSVMYFASIAMFILMHSAVMFAAGLSGTGAGRFFTAMLILFMPFVLYALVVYTCEIGNSNIDSSYYLDSKVCSALCPFYRLLNAIFNYDTAETAISEIFKTVPYIAVNYAAAVLLHKYRRTEDTTKTIIWKPVFWIVKYSVMFVGAAIGIIIFGADLFFGATSISYKIFGAVLGLFMSYIFMNCVLYRSVRSIFKDVKPSLIFASAVLLYTLVVPANLFGIVGKLYSESNTIRFVIDVDRVEVTVQSEYYEEISEYTAAYNSTGGIYSDNEIYVTGIWSDEDDEYVRENFSEYVGKPYDDTADNIYEEDLAATSIVRSCSGHISADIVQYPVFGIPMAYHIVIPMEGELWQKIKSSEEYVSAMDISDYKEAGKYESIQITVGEKSVTFSPDSTCEVIDNDFTYETYRSLDDEEKIKRDELIEKLIDSAVYDEEMLADNTIIGYVEINTGLSDNYYTITYPISAGNIDMLNAAVDLLAFAEGSERDIRYSSADEYFADAAAEYEYAVMIDLKTGEAKRIDSDTIAEYSKYTSALSYFWWEYYKYTSIDNGYMLLVKDNAGYSQELYFRNGADIENELTVLFESLD